MTMSVPVMCFIKVWFSPAAPGEPQSLIPAAAHVAALFSLARLTASSTHNNHYPLSPIIPPPLSLSLAEASTKSSTFTNSRRLPAVRWRVKCDFCKLLLNPATQESIYLLIQQRLFIYKATYMQMLNMVECLNFILYILRVWLFM